MVSWKMNPFINSAGGLLCLWSSDAFQLNNVFRGQGFLGLERVWKERNRDAVIVNVYSPCDLEGKQRLWKDLLHHKASSTISKWCVIGDFNCITKIGKIIGKNIYS